LSGGKTKPLIFVDGEQSDLVGSRSLASLGSSTPIWYISRRRLDWSGLGWGV